MSGDVQPRKRKDKKRKKDELGVEETRGTAAVFGEGDVFIHSQHDHGTGGHWCAKIIFFSLLAILVTLIGLIILENRGLTELEANSVESRYSGVLEGWLEDGPDDDHHDEHTLELKHHDGDDDDDDHELKEDDPDVKVERIEREVEEETVSAELHTPFFINNDEDSDNDDKEQDENASKEDETRNIDSGDNDDLSLEPIIEDVELPVVEHITAPSGKPFDEVEDEPSSEQPPHTLAEEEEYEKRQEELRREEEQASHKDGGNSIEDEWPGEPSDSYWRQQLDQAEQELRQDWLD